MLGRSALLAATNSMEPWEGYYSNVSLLLRGGYALANGLSDESSSSKSVTASGNAAVTTTTFKYGTSSYTFDGIDDFLIVPASADFSFGTANFTVEAWARRNNYSNPNQVLVCVFSDNASTGAPLGYGWALGMTTDLRWQAFICNNNSSTATAISSPTVAAVGQWYHLAMVRNGTDFALYVDGARVASTTIAAGFNIAPTSTTPLNVATYSNGYWGTVAYENAFSGFIDDLRITKGIARYQSAFTPPTDELPASSTDVYYSNVVLLLRGYICNPVDESPTPKAITAVGNAGISTTVFKYGSGSLVFDGSGDYGLINTQMTAFEFSGDFTIEGWFRFNVNNIGYQGLLGSAVSSDATGFVLITETNNALHFYGASTSSWNTVVSSTQVPTTGQWHHIAVCRSGSTVRLFYNGSQIGSATSSNFIRSGSSLRIGGYQYFPGGERSFNGYIDDLRITKGVARYTFNFIPPPVELPNF